MLLAQTMVVLAVQEQQQVFQQPQQLMLEVVVLAVHLAVVVLVVQVVAELDNLVMAIQVAHLNKEESIQVVVGVLEHAVELVDQA
jgi:uncharacterized membrane protein YcjF (UPF0283 family)